MLVQSSVGTGPRASEDKDDRAAVAVLERDERRDDVPPVAADEAPYFGTLFMAPYFWHPFLAPYFGDVFRSASVDGSVRIRQERPSVRPSDRPQGLSALRERC